MSTTLGKQHAHHAVMPIMLKWVYSGRDLAAYEYSAFHAELSLVYMPIMLNCLRFTRWSCLFFECWSCCYQAICIKKVPIIYYDDECSQCWNSARINSMIGNAFWTLPLALGGHQEMKNLNSYWFQRYGYFRNGCISQNRQKRIFTIIATSSANWTSAMIGQRNSQELATKHP